MQDKYDVVVGLEIHCQMNTKTKLFCGCSNDSQSVKPNTNTCPVCMGFPGQLPVVNKSAITKGIKAGLALGCEISEVSVFDRKSYFYPDSPKGYQITQQFRPITKKGKVTIETEDGLKDVGIHHMHLEGDAGKLTHETTGSLVDFNRSDTPLMEIVSEPEMNGVKEASAYAREVQRIMRYSKTSNADMEKGMMRFDINVSLKPKGQKELGTKVEVKNLNSFSSLEKALAYEIKRQAKELDAGNAIYQETRGYDDAKQITIGQRSKESAQDYRYFPEPDIPPLSHSKELVEEIRLEVGELPIQKRQKYREYGISEDEVFTLSNTLEMAEYFEEALQISNDPKRTCSLLTTVLLKKLADKNLDIQESPVSAKNLGTIVKLINEDVISFNIAKGKLMELAFETGESIEALIEKHNLKQVIDESLLESVCQKAIDSNQKAADDVRQGNHKAVGALVGFCMKESKGQLNPAHISKKLMQMLAEK
ncbi:Asp-tRNA(Asn)/Glu-tRNA(Gln) amidotransferase subunit GatB [bacterium]|jgi:aspartyl-tRNA(Asn)/glutamyl-tRNA(Gln) amidotransferase subunit B|nr:Asp-tRNA(Asn)/Glu-tRNA(Gln) amidotransferase subunit GatB [bacterium]